MQLLSYCVSDSVGVSLEGPDNASGVCVHDEDGEVVTHHTQHGAEEGEGGTRGEEEWMMEREGGEGG